MWRASEPPPDTKLSAAPNASSGGCIASASDGPCTQHRIHKEKDARPPSCKARRLFATGSRGGLPTSAPVEPDGRRNARGHGPNLRRDPPPGSPPRLRSAWRTCSPRGAILHPPIASKCSARVAQYLRWSALLPALLRGTPVFRGTRVPIRNLIDYLEAGDSLDNFLDAFPTVKREQAVAALELAGEALAASATSA